MLAVVISSAFMLLIDVSIVNVAIPGRPHGAVRGVALVAGVAFRRARAPGCARYSALAAGLVQFAFAVGTGTASWHSDRMARRLGVRVLNLGSGIVTLGMVGLLLAINAMGGQLNPWVLALLLLMAGTGLGTFIAPVTNIVLQRVRAASAGAASGVFTTAQRVGGAVGVAAIGIVFFGALPGGQSASQQVYSTAFQYALLYEVGVFALTFLLVLLLPRRRTGE